MDYWKECVSCALDDAGVTATEEQISHIAKCIENGVDCIGMAHPAPPSYVDKELKETQRLLQIERNKSVCRKCNGHGRIIESVGTSHTSNTECWECHGEGKV